MTRNILSILMLLAVFLVTGCSQGNQSQEEATEETASEESSMEAADMEAAPNTLTDAEKAEGWMLLFDGQSTDGWRGYQKENFPSAWIIDEEKQAIHIQGTGRGEVGAENGGDIIYDRTFADFHFKVEWMVDSAANAGIFYRGNEVPEYDYIWMTGPEMQVLDNAHHPDAKLGKDGNRQAGSLYDMIPADPQNFKGHGTWNQAEVLAIGKNITHIQNGDTVVQYTIGSDQMKELIAVSKWPDINPTWGDIPMEGLIGLQDHGDNVWFRNIKIKEIK